MIKTRKRSTQVPKKEEQFSVAINEELLSKYLQKFLSDSGIFKNVKNERGKISEATHEMFLQILLKFLVKCRGEFIKSLKFTGRTVGVEIVFYKKTENYTDYFGIFTFHDTNNSVVIGVSFTLEVKDIYAVVMDDYKIKQITCESQKHHECHNLNLRLKK